MSIRAARDVVLKRVPTTEPRSVTILGSTGSVGRNTVELVAADPESYAVEALVAAHPQYVFNAQFGGDLVTFTKQAAQFGFFQHTKLIAMYAYQPLQALGAAARGGEGEDEKQRVIQPGRRVGRAHEQAVGRDQRRESRRRDAEPGRRGAGPPAAPAPPRRPRW